MIHLTCTIQIYLQASYGLVGSAPEHLVIPQETHGYANTSRDMPSG